VQRKTIAVLAPGLLLGAQFCLDRRPAFAQTAPGTLIENTATGSFIDTATSTEKTLTSNTVTVQVLEVAGIGVTAQTPIEANLGEAEAILGTGNAGDYQGFDGVNTGDLIFFDFVVKNLGNDPTAFFIPLQPFSVTGATFNATAPIQIIAMDPDGAGIGYSAVTDFDGVGTQNSINVTTAGLTTTLLEAPNGYIPAGGTVTVRVPVIVTETTLTNPIKVVLGNTTPVGDQNQVYSAGTHDLYTQDLSNSTPNPYTSPTSTTPEADGSPVAEKEASAEGSTPLTAAYALNGYKSAKLTTDINSDGTVNEGETVTWTVTYVNTGSGDITNLQITDNLATLATPGTTFAGPLTITPNPNPLAGGNPTANPSYDGNTDSNANPTDINLFASGITLKPGEVVTVAIPVTIANLIPDTRTESNQASATGLKNGGAALTAVLTDNVDDVPAETLPTNVTIPASSITQTENTTSIDPTTLDVVTGVTLVLGDHGDAPNTYGTNTAVHTGTGSTLYLGSVQPDTETGPSTPLNGSGDDGTGTDEEAVTTFPILNTTGGATYSVLVNASNTSGSNAYLAGYIDFNGDGDFNDTNEQSATVTVPNAASNPQGFLVTFTTPAAGMTAGSTYARFRLSSTQSEVQSPTAAASSGEIEDYPLAITADNRDYGDAIDTGSGTASGNYQTTAADGGPSHGIVAGLLLGTAIDADDGTLQNNGANADDANNVDDEDGVGSFSTLEAIGDPTYNIKTSVTNSTASAAYVVGYIDFNRDGDFGDSGEKSATVTVTANSGTADQTLSFTTPSGITTGTTYVRIRLASVQGEAEVSTGAATAGEVEDYPITILPNLVGTGPQFTCDATLKLVTGASGTSSSLHQINRGDLFPDLSDPTAFEFVKTKVLTNSQTYSINALAYNPVDNYLYGVIIQPNSGANSNIVKGGIVQIDSTGNVSFLGIPVKADGTASLVADDDDDLQARNNFIAGNNQGYPAGTFLLDGTYVVMAEEGNDRNQVPIYLLDVTTSPPQYDYKGTISGPFFDDFAVNPQDTTPNRVYGIDDQTDRLVYFSVDPLSASVTNATSGTTSDTEFTRNYGSQFFDSFGRMLFRTGDSPNNLYILNGTTGTATSLLTGPSGGRHDGTSCNSVELEKAVNPTTVAAGSTVTYTYRIANSRLTPITLTFEDSLASVNNFPGTARNESTTPVKGTFTGVFPSPPSGGSISLLDSNRTLRISSLTVPAQSIISFSADVLIDPTIAIDPGGDPDGDTNNDKTPYFNQAELTGLPSPLPASVLSDDFTTDLAADPTIITITPATATTPELLLVKRITAWLPGNGSPSTSYTSFVDDGIANNGDNDSGWPGASGGTNTYTLGVTGLEASPGDTVEYTIYFLNTGNGPATNVKICDRLSPYLTYIPTTYGIAPDYGIRLVFGNGSDTRSLTGSNDGDLGQLVGAGVDLTGTCKFLNDKGTSTPDDDTVDDVGAVQNVNGVVLVTPTGGSSPSQLEVSTGAGTPNTSYGYIRFRATVK